MLFNTSAFGIFLVVVVSLSWAIGARRARVGLLLLASYWFYACWDPRFVLLIFGVTLIDYLGARIVARLERGARLYALSLTIGLNLGFLGFWKYTDFFGAALSASFEPLGLLLPVGISFFTFQGLSYVIDVYRGDIAPERSLTRFALYIAFFPQLVAGPIVRARELLPQLERPLPLDTDRFGRALALILAGLVKKVVMADYLAANLVDRVFDLPSHYSSLEVLLGVYAYALQIYGDFSGYCDIAVGAALLLGVELPINFDLPYRADGIRDFWRRWHITLSTWLRDYLYIPLGGSRHGRHITDRNLLVTMLLGGLWHGASYNFVVWGGLHGAWLCLDRRWSLSKLPRWARIALTFHGVCALWVFFRADTFAGALRVFAQIGSLSRGASNLTWPMLVIIAGGYLLHHAPPRWHERLVREFVRAPAYAQAGAVVLLLHLVQRVASSGAAPFIYFQF